MMLGMNIVNFASYLCASRVSINVDRLLLSVNSLHRICSFRSSTIRQYTMSTHLLKARHHRQ
jgi:hypothetical protein